MLFSTKEFRVCAAIGCASLAVLATGCIDDSYDLSNIDSNFELKIDDLTVPFEMKKEVTLSTFVDAD
ncbi:MAG: hypothetical protein K2M97_06700, partial [Muribaculaceae bacterium]|nr:hypothetical protein [Muribaculaceae bacterium]